MGLVRDLPRTGWPAALLTYLVVAWSLTAVGVSTADVVTITGYAVLGLVLPGTLLWRLLCGPAPRPFVRDVVFGTSLAYAVELGVYAAARATGHPRAVLLWPLLVVAVSLLPRLRDRAWRPPTRRQPLAWSWGLAAMVLFTFGWIARHQWWPAPLTPDALRFPYVDEPYHLSLVAALRRELPAGLPFVDGEPLRYHWFAHADLAAASWSTGIEPVVLLQRLGPVPMIVVVLLGTSLLAQAVARSRAAALLAPALVTVLGTAQLPPGFGAVFVTDNLYLSPTMTFAQALLVAAVAASLPLLTHGARGRPGMWVAAVLPLLALSGAKGTALPVLVAGYAGVLLMTAVLRRRLHRAAAVLLVVSVAAVLLAQEFVYGRTAQGLAWGPLGVGRYYAAHLGLADDPAAATLGVTLAVSLVYALTQLSYACGLVGLFTGGVWRTPAAQFLVGAAAAGVGATLAFEDTSLNEVYFLRTVPLLLAVTSAWGFVLLARRADARAARVALPAALLAGGALALVVREAAGPVPATGTTLRALLLPTLVVAAVIAAVSLAVRVAAGRARPRWRHLAAPVALGMVLGLGLPYAVDLATETVRDPVPTGFERPPESEATIGRGGVPAARWLRAHSGVDDLVATNAHCRRTGRHLCDARMFWLAGYSERQILVEGWTYSPRTAARAPLFDLPVCCLPFWDQRTLEDNDAAFRHPSRRGVTRLRDEYGVDWLVLDTRRRSRPEELARWADLVYSRGQYKVFRLR